jgi:hypothetical protein
MTIAVDTYLVVALAFAVFAAVTSLGSSLVLGIGFERLRAGFELIKSQTAFFSDSLHKLDKRMDGAEKQDRYFFETLHNLEEQAARQAEPAPAAEAEKEIPVLISTARPAEQRMPALSRFGEGMEDEIRFH